MSNDDDDAWSATAVIGDLQRIPAPDGIAEERVVVLGGVPQMVYIRGVQRSNPVLLMIHGGPGTPLSPTMWVWQRPLEEFFTVVQYDQRGSGRSYGRTDPDLVRDLLSPQRFADDAVELAEYLCRELGVDTVTLAGHSWGTVPGVQAALDRPDLFSSYVGIGQMISYRQGEEASWAWARQEAERRGHTEAVQQLDALAPYPGEGPVEVDRIIAERTWVHAFGGFAAWRTECNYFMEGGVASPDYTDADREDLLAGNLLHAEVLLTQLHTVDFTDVDTFPIPIFQFVGQHDYMTPADPVISWMDGLDAPAKAVERFRFSAHMMMYEEPGHFLISMVTHALPHARGPEDQRVSS